jgi:hypothetical protein
MRPNTFHAQRGLMTTGIELPEQKPAKKKSKRSEAWRAIDQSSYRGASQKVLFYIWKKTYRRNSTIDNPELPVKTTARAIATHERNAESTYRVAIAKLIKDKAISAKDAPDSKRHQRIFKLKVTVIERKKKKYRPTTKEFRHADALRKRNERAVKDAEKELQRKAVTAVVAAAFLRPLPDHVYSDEIHQRLIRTRALVDPASDRQAVHA